MDQIDRASSSSKCAAMCENLNATSETGEESADFIFKSTSRKGLCRYEIVLMLDNDLTRKFSQVWISQFQSQFPILDVQVV